MKLRKKFERQRNVVTYVYLANRQQAAAYFGALKEQLGEQKISSVEKESYKIKKSFSALRLNREKLVKNRKGKKRVGSHAKKKLNTQYSKRSSKGKNAELSKKKGGEKKKRNPKSKWCTSAKSTKKKTQKSGGRESCGKGEGAGQRTLRTWVGVGGALPHTKKKQSTEEI